MWSQIFNQMSGTWSNFQLKVVIPKRRKRFLLEDVGMGWRVPINSKHVLSWSHLCLKPPSMSHAQPYVRVAHTRIVVVTPLLKAAFTRLYTKVWPRHYVPMPFSYITHTHTHAHTPTHTFPLYCILGTIGPIEPKFCMHMECDQTIKSHKNIKLIWGHLGYANEGQWRHNVLRSIEVKSHLPVNGFLPNFDML